MVQRVNQTQLFRGFSSLDGNLSTLYDIELVKRDLLNQFYTRRGERVMYPNFGSIIWDSLFEPFTDSLREEIVEDTRRILDSDPRLEVENLIVDEFEHGIVIDATINYVPFAQTDRLAIEFDRRALEENN